MFNMGFTELIFLAVIALVVIGPKQLPQVARTIARLLNEFKRATSDVTSSFRDIKDEAQKTINETTSSITKNFMGSEGDNYKFFLWLWIQGRVMDGIGCPQKFPWSLLKILKKLLN